MQEAVHVHVFFLGLCLYLFFPFRAFYTDIVIISSWQVIDLVDDKQFLCLVCHLGCFFWWVFVSLILGEFFGGQVGCS